MRPWALLDGVDALVRVVRALGSLRDEMCVRALLDGVGALVRVVRALGSLRDEMRARVAAVDALKRVVRARG